MSIQLQKNLAPLLTISILHLTGAQLPEVEFTLPTFVPGPSNTTGLIRGGVDFTNATLLPDGRLCVIKETSVDVAIKEPILSCTHKNVEKCHTSYVTLFGPTQEEVCEDIYEKKCQITFIQEAIKETIRHCYRRQEKFCNGTGEEVCKTVYESSCSTKYEQTATGHYEGNTTCEKIPYEICGRGCVSQEGPEECQDKEMDTLVEVPSEICHLSPEKRCTTKTKLVPSLKPNTECTTVPYTTCAFNFSPPKKETKSLRSEWCLGDDDSVTSTPIPEEDTDNFA
jgi:hypothetical protein